MMWDNISLTVVGLIFFSLLKHRDGGIPLRHIRPLKALDPRVPGYERWAALGFHLRWEIVRRNGRARA